MYNFRKNTFMQSTIWQWEDRAPAMAMLIVVCLLYRNMKIFQEWSMVNVNVNITLMETIVNCVYLATMMFLGCPDLVTKRTNVKVSCSKQLFLWINLPKQKTKKKLIFIQKFQNVIAMTILIPVTLIPAYLYILEMLLEESVKIVLIILKEWNVNLALKVFTRIRQW